jgi:DNA-binding MarR family transcriptional regulator
MINRASRTLRKFFNQELIKRGYNITVEQFDVLIHLWNRDGQHQQQLAQTLCKDKTTMTRLIKSIEELNLVMRRENKNDKRQKLVCMTSSGKKMMRELTNLVQRVHMKAQKGISPADLATCKNVLVQLHQALSKELT